MQRKHYPGALLIVAFLFSGSLYLSSVISPASPEHTLEAVSELSAERYINDVRYLSRTEMKGRGNGFPELDEAAEYIASQFRVWGVRPAGEDQEYFQQFEVTTAVDFGARNELEIDGTRLEINRGFVPIAFSNTAEFRSTAVFVGYGITAPELRYDDYQDVDVDGKIVIALRHEPQELEPHSAFNGSDFTTHATFINKAVNAKHHGAKGIIFVTDPNNHRASEDDVGPATRAVQSNDLGIPAVHVRLDSVQRVFEEAGKDLSVIQTEIDRDLEPQSFDLPNTQIRIATEVRRVRSPVRNVIGAVGGSDPVLKDEWIVAGAHYDHLGLGERGSLSPSLAGEVHHGADDNASGTSGILELARVAARNKDSLKRSVLFMAFAGEEIGLLGSAYFVANPTVPPENIVGMVNLDMIGRLRNQRLFVGGIGTASRFRSWIEEINRPIDLRLDYSNSGYGASDHTSFNAQRIPVLFFFSGLHSDYHRPSDTYDKINAEGAVKVLSVAYGMLERMANTEERLQYAEVREPRPVSGGGGGYGPYFGSVPDFRDDLQGVLFADVTPDSPAAKAGLQAGDLLVEFDGRPIDNLYDFTYALRAKRPDDEVSVVVKRNGQDMRVTVILEPRR